MAREQHSQHQRQLNDISIDIETRCAGCLAAGHFIQSALGAEGATRDMAFDKRVNQWQFITSHFIVFKIFKIKFVFC